ncbi:two component transcriptional regulator, AraC family protein [Planococcus donghaensis MPA1U2]|uniref:Two component transcriptional regulator, AraC family protein n=1 Tax=Planococcus donghaensis MPA1U2 TaxID=933115 RepID=E7RDU4_9BACL|nr:response regulator [Planococcus donghaensis]EGA90850.1 two component transcriptional regulator, AraC family protein [Planococcus donghaensis MPA1U2]
MHKLLIVDDEWMIREGLEKTVPWNEWNIEVVGTAKNGYEALEILKKLTVDILLTDIRMPKMNGLELIEVCKQQYPSMRIVLLSGHDEFSYAQKALRLGVSDYLLKPTDFHELKRVMLTASQELMMAKETFDSGLPLLLESLIASPSTDKFEQLKQQPEFKSGYGTMIIYHKEGNLPKIEFENFLSIKTKESATILFFYQLENEEHWKQLISDQTNFLQQSGFKGIIKTGSFSEEIEQLYSLYLQATAASLPLYQDQCLEVYLYNENKRDPSILNIIQFVSDNLEMPLNQTEFAKELHMSNSNFSKVFKQYTGMNFVDFITEKRIAKAKELLTYTNLKTTEIAQQIGYPEVRYFHQVFKKRVGCSPGGFREETYSKSASEDV